MWLEDNEHLILTIDDICNNLNLTTDNPCIRPENQWSKMIKTINNTNTHENQTQIITMD